MTKVSIAAKPLGPASQAFGQIMHWSDDEVLTFHNGTMFANDP